MNVCARDGFFEGVEENVATSLPTNSDGNIIHAYSRDSFQLGGVATPRSGEVVGLVGSNGTGKSTVLKILAGKLKPNLGNLSDPPEWPEILSSFNTSELQNYFTEVLEDKLTTALKPQYVEQLPRVIRGTVGGILCRGESDNEHAIVELLGLANILERDIRDLSGGELQRFAIAAVCVRNANVNMFDEPSNYLDIKQRLNAAKAIRSLIRPDKYVLVAEHDLAVLDYLCDFICCLYGIPGVYGAITVPFSVHQGIGVFLDGVLPTENFVFREHSLDFRLIKDRDEDELKRRHQYEYQATTVLSKGFQLKVEAAFFSDPEIIVLLGENGTGKTTLMRRMARFLQPVNRMVPNLKFSHKPQNISQTWNNTVRALLQAELQNAYNHPQFMTTVMEPLKLGDIMDDEVQNLSGGELQRLALVLCLGKPADVYLIDEPSAYLDAEQRLIAAQVIKRFIFRTKKMAFVVEHDFTVATYLADRFIVFEGQPSRETKASAPQAFLPGINRFLDMLNVTVRRDSNRYRPHINKENSIEDLGQKQSGCYFFLQD